MTRKDYQVIAEMLANIIFSQEYLGLEDIWENKKMVDVYLKKTNPNYSSEKFWEAVNKNILELKGITK